MMHSSHFFTSLHFFPRTSVYVVVESRFVPSSRSLRLSWLKNSLRILTMDKLWGFFLLSTPLLACLVPGANGTAGQCLCNVPYWIHWKWTGERVLLPNLGNVWLNFTLSNNFSSNVSFCVAEIDSYLVLLCKQYSPSINTLGLNSRRLRSLALFYTQRLHLCL